MQHKFCESVMAEMLALLHIEIAQIHPERLISSSSHLATIAILHIHHQFRIDQRYHVIAG